VSVRIVTPADGTMSVTFGWDLAEVILQGGQLVSVDPGSALETEIGTENLTDPTAQDLASSANGGGGAVSN
jgi:hypothetical protein